MKSKPLTYADSGVNYQTLDQFKLLAQKAAAKTATNGSINEMPATRGESAYVWEEKNAYRAFVIEGLGTKNRIADAMRKITGKTYYDAIAQDTVAMIINDLIVVGAKPEVITAYFAVGNSEWFTDLKRTKDLVTGWATACQKSGAVWGGGETPTLTSIIQPDAIDLAGSAIGIIKPKKRVVLGDKLVAGDRILLIESSGIHANGLTLARAIAEKLPQGYATLLSSGEMYGEALLAPTHIYSPLVQSLLQANCSIHYMVNITGHGWRKLMRATKTFTYRITQVPPQPNLFEFIQKEGQINSKEMYANFNMGAGFAIFLPAKDVVKAQKIAQKHKLRSSDAGVVETGKKQVMIEPLNLTFAQETLHVR